MQPGKLIKFYNEMLNFALNCKLSHPLDGNVGVSATQCKSQWGCLHPKNHILVCILRVALKINHQDYNTAVFIL